MATLVDAERNEHFSITLPTSARVKLDANAKARGLSRAAVIRELVLVCIERGALGQEIEQAVA